jgi:hypothetical protein
VGIVRGAMAVSADGSVAGPAAAAQAVASGAANVGFQIDRDRIPGVIADLNHAMDALQRASSEAEQHRNLVAPGPDPYSPGATEKLGARLVDDYQDANDRDRRNIQAMIDNLDAAMRHYDAHDDVAAQSLPHPKM